MKSVGIESFVFRIAGLAVMISVYVFLFAPLVVVVGASFDGGEHAFMNFPPKQFSLAWYWNIPARYYKSLWISLVVAAVSSGFAILIGVPAAMGLVRGSFRGKELLAGIFRAPLQIPFVVTGIAFLQVYYLMGATLGINPNGTFVGLMIAHTFVATPYVIGTVGAILHGFDYSLEEAALSLGANGWSTFRRITLPLIMPGLYAGALYAFIISFGNVPVSLFLAGPRYTPFPVEVFNAMEFDFNASILAISTLILFFSLVIIWGIQRAVGIDALLRSGRSS